MTRRPVQKSSVTAVFNDTANAAKNLAETIEEILLRDIASGVYPPGGMFPSEYDSVSRFGCSRVTIRRVYADLERRGVIVRKVRSGTFVSDSIRANSSALNLICALLPLEHNFAREFLTHLNAVAAAHNALVVLSPPFKDSDEQAQAALTMAMNGVRNMVVWGIDSQLDLDVFRRLRLLGVNMVFFDQVAPHALADYVCLDDALAISTLLDKARADGCLDFVFVNTGGFKVKTNQAREKYFVKYCSQNNLPYRCVSLPWNNLLAGGAEAEDSCRKLVESIPALETTAIVTANDFLTSAIYKTAGGAGKYYSIAMETVIQTKPNVFNIVQPMLTMAEVCFDMLREQMIKGQEWKARSITIPGAPSWFRGAQP